MKHTMKQRLDKVIVERGLLPSRERAKAMIMRGKVLVDERPVLKAGAMVDGASCRITFMENDIPYVSRGGLKLEAALEKFGIELAGRVAMDVGASTGGFTDCMLKRGASKVYCIDVGYGQFDWRLRNDPRVTLFERTNIRHMDTGLLAESPGFGAVDVSFISLRLVLPKMMEFLAPGAEIVALVKPQFELKKEDVSRGGIVKDELKRLEALKSVKSASKEAGLQALGEMESPIKGQKGNVEFLLHLRKG